MGTFHHIADAGDPRCAAYRNLPDPELAARRGRFVAEGRLVVRRLLAGSRFAVESVMVTEPALAAVADLLAARPDLPVYVVPQAVMNDVTGFNIHRGCLAMGERPPVPPWPTLAAAVRRLLVLERIGNADNVGAAFRNAAALGAGGVLLGPACADPLYRKAIRTSMGAALTLPFARAHPWPDVLGALRSNGWAVVALTPRGDTPLPEIATAGNDRPVAIVVGHEGEGLTGEALAACSHRVRIPMAAGADSVNVATAAAIALYELHVSEARSSGPDARTRNDAPRTSNDES